MMRHLQLRSLETTAGAEEDLAAAALAAVGLARASQRAAGM